ncbi:MAG: ribbon-helix-helix protein, CopG family [Lysobacteraceae bacterium]
MSDPEIRLNARLVGEDAERFRALMRSEGLSTSDLLRTALRHYHAARQRAAASPLAAFEHSGFLAGADGPPDLSGDYKRHLSAALETKHRHRVNEPAE